MKKAINSSRGHVAQYSGTRTIGSDPTFKVVVNDSNWVKTFPALPVVHEPGSRFLYNSLATYMLSAIVEKVTGEKVIDFLTHRIFDPRGIGAGSWGLQLKTENMAKFGQ